MQSNNLQQNEREGCRRPMFFRWKKAVFVMCLMGGLKERVGWKRTHKVADELNLELTMLMN